MSNLPGVVLSDRENKIEKGGYTHQDIDNHKADVPPKLRDIDFGLHSNHNNHTAPSNGLNNQCKHLKKTKVNNHRHENIFKLAYSCRINYKKGIRCCYIHKYIQPLNLCS